MWRLVFFSHINANVDKLIANDNYLQKNNIIKIGCLSGFHGYMHKDNEDPFLDRIVYKQTYRDEFWEELKSEVRAYIKSTKQSVHYTYQQGLLFILYYSAIYIGLSYLAWFQGSFIAAALLGLHLLCTVTNVSHMATHFGFTKYKGLNMVAKYFFDLSGMSWLEWQIAHQTHHNQPHSSIDYQTNAYGYIGIRIHEHEEYKWYHKYQPVYFWIVISFYLIFRLVATTYWLFKNKEFVRHKHELINHLLIRGFFLAQVIYCGYLHGALMAFGLFMAYSMAYSYASFILLYNDHEETHQPLGSMEDVTPHHGHTSWAKTQIITSNNWYPNNWLLKFIEFHYGYFNFHIEHHLFPAFKPRLCKNISPIVKRISAKHGIPYISTTFMEVQQSLQKHLTKLSRNPATERHSN